MVVKKSQIMRVFELYGVMMVIIIISWIIYSIFRVKEPANSDPYETETAQPLHRPNVHMQLEKPPHSLRGFHPKEESKQI